MSLKTLQLTVVRFKDRLIPDDYLHKIVQRFPTAHGGAFAEDGQIRLIQDTGPVSFETLKQWQEEQKDLAMLMTFSRAGKSILQADLQPFILLRDAKDQPLVVGSLIGDFTASEDESSDRTSIGLAVEDHIQGVLAELLTECKGSLKDFWAKINDKGEAEKFAKSLFMQTKNGWITMLGADGTIKSLLKGNLEAGKLLDKNWGFSSLDLNKVEEEVKQPDKVAEPAAAPAAPPAPPTKKRSFGGPSVSVASTESVRPTPAPDKPAIEPNKQPATAIPPPKEEMLQLESGHTFEGGTLFYKCPDAPGFSTKAQIRDAYERNLGRKPDNFMAKPKLEVTDQKILARYKGVLAAGVVEALEPGKHPSEMAGDVVERVETPPQPIITAGEKKKLAEIILNNANLLKSLELKDGEDRLPKPDEMQAMEGELPTFAESAGLTGILDTSKWWYGDWKEILEGGCQTSILKALLDWRFYAITQAQRVRQLEARVGELDKPTEEKKPAQQAAAPDTKKRRSFGG